MVWSYYSPIPRGGGGAGILLFQMISTGHRKGKGVDTLWIIRAPIGKYLRPDLILARDNTSCGEANMHHL